MELEERNMAMSDEKLGPESRERDNKLVESPPESYSKNYAKLADVPADVLASRIVGSLILRKGNLNEYKAVLTKFIQDYREAGEWDMAERAAQAPELILDSVRKYYEVAAGFENGTLAGHKEIALLNLVAVIGEQTAAWLRALAGVPAEEKP
jgi:hypothetical protein